MWDIIFFIFVEQLSFMIYFLNFFNSIKLSTLKLTIIKIFKTKLKLSYPPLIVHVKIYTCLIG